MARSRRSYVDMESCVEDSVFASGDESAVADRKQPAALDRVSTGSHAFFLDVDGTLLDIAPHPDAVHVPDHLPACLRDLSNRAAGALALVSGRSVKRLDGLFWPTRLAAAGSHGAQLRHSPDGPVEAAPDLDPPIAGRLVELAASLDGVLAEDKGPSIAIHYRAQPAIAPVLRRAIDTVIAGRSDLTVLPGHYVFEVKGAAHDKGTAVRSFMAHAPFRGRIPVFIGDDVTDEAAFRAVANAGGLAIAVGAPRPGADIVLPDPEAVRRFLARLAARPRQQRR